MVNLLLTYIKVRALKDSAITGKYIVELFDCATELKRIDNNWYARKTISTVNNKALKALGQYNQIRNYYNQLDFQEIVASINDIQSKLPLQPKNSILNLVEYNNLKSKLNDLGSLKRLKGFFPILPEADELINFLYSPMTGTKLFST